MISTQELPVIHDSMTGEKRLLEPIRAGEIRMYVCGITVYDYLHVGHARMLSVFDMVQRYLRVCGLRVTYVRNITDIDDKIIARAAERGEDWHALAQRFIVTMNEDCARLGLQTPDLEPRATEYIPAIVDLIRALVANGIAYQAANGDVLYAVRKFPRYGQLSKRDPDEMRAGARVQIDAAKADPLDFVLWKRAKAGEPYWASPWGDGRPGWHIECSAMSMQTLGAHFDVHGGGMDLLFPHHENEIAQSCGACDTRFVNLWMHNGFVRIDDEKMSKSAGNFLRLRDIMDSVRDAEVVRFFLLSSHYRGPINFSNEQIRQADETLLGLYRALLGVETQGAELDAAGMARFHAAMRDDFNTPEAFAVAQACARQLNVAKAAGRTLDAQRAAATLRAMGAALGLWQQPPQAYLQRESAHRQSRDAILPEEIEARLAARSAARHARDFATSDRIRDELLEAGIVVDDMPGGKAQWRRA